MKKLKNNLTSNSVKNNEEKILNSLKKITIVSIVNSVVFLIILIYNLLLKFNHWTYNSNYSYIYLILGPTIFSCWVVGIVESSKIHKITDNDISLVVTASFWFGPPLLVTSIMMERKLKRDLKK